MKRLDLPLYVLACTLLTAMAPLPAQAVASNVAPADAVAADAADTVGADTVAATLGPHAPTLPPDSVHHIDAALTDQAGNTIAWRDTGGAPQVVSMFYTGCRYVCPLIIDSARGVEHALGDAERAKLRVTLVSMDPARDTPEALARVAERRHLDAARWRLLRPSPGDVRALAAVLGIRYRALADGEFNHTSALVLLDAQGRVLARTEKLGAVPDPAFLAAVRAALAAPDGAG